MSPTSWPTSLPSDRTPMSTLPLSPLRKAQRVSLALQLGIERLSSSVADSAWAMRERRAANVVMAFSTGLATRGRRKCLARVPPCHHQTP
jgi:hypothetical protein